MSAWRPGEPVLWFTQGAQNNPGTSTVLAETGAIAALGNYQAHITISTDATAVLNIQWRDAANAANVQEHRVFMAANQNLEFLIPGRIDHANERWRVIPNAAVTGNVCVSLFWQKMA